MLGKIIGVYLGRPVEGWDHERIISELGKIYYYVNDRRDLPLKNDTLVVTDDISGTFTFLRALPDYDNSRGLTSAQIGQSWLNYIIERRTILWWGGLGNSTEHTAFLSLKNDISAPESGSVALNSRIVADSDGLVEAHNPYGEMFGFARLRALVAEHGEEASLGNLLLEELHSFTGEGWEQEDDITLLTL